MSDSLPAPAEPTGTIDAYLDELLGRLVTRPERTRRILAEVDDHLREAAARHEADGLAPADAERRAVASFGSARTVARRFAAADGRLLPPSLALNVLVALTVMAGVGLIAIGVSGGVAAAMGAAWGREFVAGDAPGVTYTPERCADFMRVQPQATSCAEAALGDHFEEVVHYRVLVGVLGLIVLSGAFVFRRRYPRLSGVRLLPAIFMPTVGASLFGIAAAGLALQSAALSLGGDTTGLGMWLSGSLVSLVAFAWYARQLARSLVAGTLSPTPSQ